MRDALLGSICVEFVDSDGDDYPCNCGRSSHGSAKDREGIHDAQLNMGTKKAPPFGRAFESDNLLLCKPVIQLGAGDKRALRPPVGFARAHGHLGVPSTKAGRRVIYQLADLRSWLDAHRFVPQPDAPESNATPFPPVPLDDHGGV